MLRDKGEGTRQGMTSPMKVITLGCRLNHYESAVMKQMADDNGVTNHVIIHSCAVTHEAERQSRQAVRRARKRYPHATIVVTGCSAQIHPDMYRAMKDVDMVVGNDRKTDVSLYRMLATDKGDSAEQRRMDGKDKRALDESLSSSMARSFFGRVRGFVAVQHGCDHHCTFCIIPQGRGEHRSMPIDDVVRQSSLLAQAGAKEIVLTGVDMASWGREDGRMLGELVEAVLHHVPTVKRWRLSSLDPFPVACDTRLQALYADHPHMMPYMHLSVQAGDNMVLKRMRRRHCREDVIQLCHGMCEKREDMVFGADMIAGFPTESDAMHSRSVSLLEEAGLVLNHIFPYSVRHGTPAARMPRLERATCVLRAERLRRHGVALRDAMVRRQIQRGDSSRVLIERVDAEGRLWARSDSYMPVRIEEARTGAHMAYGQGDVVSCRFLSVGHDGVIGSILGREGETDGGV
ncbi:MAG: tRNA (N(6)-L-threonylcarbamoyladenosine(37)-C(2))-methylthiotransferase MtaB [Alphaproteobacteria bacterium GM7ARS4]|nr:tRNA (N(6)-L-threonylcarbamoyladenosine(37)-C(2))-methylthiotransferase MtaB [Alphaproteobacteria bacterium GM7ARS4]